MTTLIILLFSFLGEDMTPEGYVLTGRSVGAEVDDSNYPTEPTVSKCLRWKWKFLVSFYDINGDGIISVDDLNKARTVFSQLQKLTGEDKKIKEELFTQWWTLMIFWNKTEITVNEFVDLQSIAFLDDKENFLEKMRNLSQLLARCHDVDNDGYISPEEKTDFLKIAVLTYNIHDKYFYTGGYYDERSISIRGMTHLWVLFLTEDSCSDDDLMIRLSESS